MTTIQSNVKWISQRPAHKNLIKRVPHSYSINYCEYYRHHKNNCQKIMILPAHSMITKHDCLLRGSCFCEKYRCPGCLWLFNPRRTKAFYAHQQNNGAPDTKCVSLGLRVLRHEKGIHLTRADMIADGGMTEEHYLLL